MSAKFPMPHSVKNAFLIIALAMSITGCVSGGGGSQASVGDVGVSGSDGSSGNDTGGPGPQIGSFSLAWTAPVTRSVGSPMSLAEIDGYRVYYGSTQGDYPDSVDINDGSATATTISGVPTGDYYIVMTTYDSEGRESTQSGAVLKQAI